MVAQMRGCADVPTPFSGDEEWPPPEIEPAFRGIVRAGQTFLTVRGLGDRPICVPRGWIESVESFELSADRRFLDFDHLGFQSNGHILVDRRSRQAIETETWPEFSASGHLFVAVPRDDDDDDERSNGPIAVWQILPDRLVTRALLPAPPGRSWRVDRWVGDSCVELSAIALERYWTVLVSSPSGDDADAELARQPRLRFRLWHFGGAWRIENMSDAGRCARIDVPGSGHDLPA